ncbi:hypothetical protein BC826DRAFT_1018024 [Russula brevipes]|nr:hypothetical protein BC826DRAFT_1018024 [Russula brevipes]
MASPVQRSKDTPLARGRHEFEFRHNSNIKRSVFPSSLRTLSQTTSAMVLCWRGRGRFDDYNDYYYHHRRRNRHHAVFTGFCLISASILFMFIALSLPIIKSVYLLQLSGQPASSQPATSIGTELRFGVWGFVSRGPHRPARAAPGGRRLAFLTLLPVIASCCVFHTAPWVISLVLSVATAIISTLVFAADLALVIVARHKLKSQHTVNVTISFGNGVWIVLVGMLFTWVALILLSARVCRCCGFGREDEVDIQGGRDGQDSSESGEKP